MSIEPNYRGLFQSSNDWSKDLGQLVMLAADGKLTLSVMPENWEAQIVKSSGDTKMIDKESIVTLDDWVKLLPKDIMSSVNQGKIIARTVRLNNGDIAGLVECREVIYERLYVSLAERNRFEKTFNLKQKSETWNVQDAIDLIKSDPHCSRELGIALDSWSRTKALSNGKKSHKEQIEIDLKKHEPGLSDRAMERISTLLNLKPEGGSPKSNSRY